MSDSRILIVDDEPGVLHALHRLLRSRPCRYGQLAYTLDVETFESPAAALARAAEAPFDLVLTYFRMPETDGIAFRSRFRRIQPDAARIVLSGAAELDDMMRGISEVDTSRFLPKPWNDQLLVATIAEALTLHQLQRERAAGA